MKKIFKILLIITMLLAIATTVNAVSSNEFLSYVTSSKTVAGQSVTLVSSDQKVQIERYIKRNNLSESTLDYLKGQFDEGVKIMDEANVTSYSALSESDKAKIKNIASQTSSTTGIKYTVNSNGEAEIYNLDGTLFTKLSSNGNIIKQTGNSNYIYIISIIAIVAVAILAIFKRSLKSEK